MVIKTKEKENLVLYFVDYPLHVKKLIEKHMNEIKSMEEDPPTDDFDQAA